MAKSSQGSLVNIFATVKGYDNLDTHIIYALICIYMYHLYILYFEIY